MIVLGIDTAIRCTGYGVIDIQHGGYLTILACGVIKNKQKAPHSECLRRLYGGVQELCDNFKLEVAALESAFFQKNIKTAMILSYARGAIMTALVNKEVPTYAYSPRQAKKAVVGTGAASKIQVATMIASLTNLNIDSIPMDSTDALAIAICHGQIAVLPSSDNFLGKPL